MFTHSNKRDQFLIREESWFEEDILKSRRSQSYPNHQSDTHNGTIHPISTTLLLDIVTYLECPTIGDLSDELDHSIWLYEEAIHRCGNTTLSVNLYADNHQEEIVQVWYFSMD